MVQLEEELANRVRQPRQKVIPRPSRWDDVNLKPIPLQEGEDEGIAAVDEGPSAPPPIPDPLSLRDVDLRETQEIYATGIFLCFVCINCSNATANSLLKVDYRRE